MASQKEAARNFSLKWMDTKRGHEDEDDRSFWIELLQTVYGVPNPTEKMEFQKKVKGMHGGTRRIDIYIPETAVLIEQKSRGIDLDKPQASHDGKTPFEQAKDYDNDLGKSEKASWIIVSNFDEIWIYNMNQQNPKPEKIRVSDLQTKYTALDFLVKKEVHEVSYEVQISKEAGQIVKKLYEGLLAQYENPNDKDSLRSLNILCVRLVFCLYAEDADVFGKKSMFYDYLKDFDQHTVRKALENLFEVLNQKPENRDKYLKADNPKLAQFPYVNGGLFDGYVEVPPFTGELFDFLLNTASKIFDWSEISPTIFGAVFESTLNPDTRRKGGMHYTSIENIHKVIDPLFLDDLKKELEEILKIDVIVTKRNKLTAYQKKLASLTFFDPACGSGNFLTETYISIRKIENIVIRELLDMRKGQVEGQVILGFDDLNPIQVSISQFYGIEINDFAVSVAKTALWIAENQMMNETSKIIFSNIDFLPLKTNAYILEENSVQYDWENLLPRFRCSYIMGNPPFVGARLMSDEQKVDIKKLFAGWKSAGNLDYVSCWYKKAADYMKGTNIKAALVSTNSVTQGESVSILFKPLFQQGMHFDFAYRTFRWDSEATEKAHVHVVIIGFSFCKSNQPKRIFESSGDVIEAHNINAYLLDCDNYFIDNRNNPICDVPQIVFGSMANDGGNLILSEEEVVLFCSENSKCSQFIRKYVGSDEFINNKSRYCLWLYDADSDDYNSINCISERIDLVKAFRESSDRGATNKLAKTPHLFGEIRQPLKGSYLMIPRVSSESRTYIPIGFFDASVIASDAVQIIPDATLYHFGVLTSNVHMAWVKTVCGRLKSDYRYSAGIVYNNFPWPSPTDAQRNEIEKTAQEILDVRAKYPSYTLANLYDKRKIPNDLVDAHNRNNAAVMRAYGFYVKSMSSEECVKALFLLNEKILKNI